MKFSYKYLHFEWEERMHEIACDFQGCERNFESMNLINVPTLFRHIWKALQDFISDGQYCIEYIAITKHDLLKSDFDCFKRKAFPHNLELQIFSRTA